MNAQLSLARLLIIPLAVLITFLPMACNEAEEHAKLPDESLAMTTGQYQDVEDAFAALVAEPKLVKQHIAKQMQFLAADQIANQKFSVERAVNAHNNAPKATINLAAASILQQAVSLLSVHGFSLEAGQELEQLYTKLGASIGQLEPTERSLVEEQLRFMYFLANSPSFQIYAGIIGGQTQEKGDAFPCISSMLYLAGLTAACSSGQFYACLGIPYVLYLVSEYCGVGGGDPVDPCENNPSLCCGIDCIQGYACNSSNGECEEIPGYDCYGGCPPGEQCIDGVCMPF